MTSPIGNVVTLKDMGGERDGEEGSGIIPGYSPKTAKAISSKLSILSEGFLRV